MWKMDPDFFVGFPETYDDIVPALDIERPIGQADMFQLVNPRPRLLPLPEDLDETDQHKGGFIPPSFRASQALIPFPELAVQ